MDTRTQGNGKGKAFQLVMRLGKQGGCKAGHRLSTVNFSCAQKSRSCKERFTPKILDSKTSIISPDRLRLVLDKALNARLQEYTLAWITKCSKMQTPESTDAWSTCTDDVTRLLSTERSFA